MILAFGITRATHYLLHCFSIFSTLCIWRVWLEKIYITVLIQLSYLYFYVKRYFFKFRTWKHIAICSKSTFSDQTPCVFTNFSSQLKRYPYTFRFPQEMETSHNLENPLKIFNQLDGFTYKVPKKFLLYFLCWNLSKKQDLILIGCYWLESCKVLSLRESRWSELNFEYNRRS